MEHVLVPSLPDTDIHTFVPSLPDTDIHISVSCKSGLTGKSTRKANVHIDVSPVSLTV